MKCKIKNNITAYGALSIPNINRSNIDSVIYTYNDIMKSLGNFGTILNSPNFDDAAMDKIKLKGALERIPALKDFGLILSGSKQVQGAITVASNKFLTSVVTDPSQAFQYLNSMFSTGSKQIISNTEEGFTSEMSAKDLNNILTQMTSSYLNNTEGTYITKSNGILHITAEGRDMLNNYHYAKYLQSFGSIVNPTVENDNNAPSEIKNEVYKLNTGPAIALLNESIGNEQEKKKRLHEEGKLTPTKTAELTRRISELVARKKSVNRKMEQDAFVDYLHQVVKDASSVLVANFDMTEEDVITHERALVIVINAAEQGNENNIFDFGERQDRELMDRVQNIAKDARTLSEHLRNISFTLNKDNMEQFFNTEMSNQDINTVGNLKTSIAVKAAEFLSSYHVDNPIVQYITDVVEKSLIVSQMRATEFNNKITELFNKAKDSGFDISLFEGRDSKNNITGRLTGEFSADYYDRELALKNTPASRKRLMQEFDPTILYGLETTNPKRVDLEKRLKSDLGEHMFEVYNSEQNALWQEYKANEEYILNGDYTQEKKDSWVRSNSPKYRIDNYARKVPKGTENKEDIVGTDKYLVVVPRRLSISGKDTGLYDKNFDAIARNPDAMRLYEEIRTAHLKFQMALHNYEEKFKPPKLGFIRKAVSDMVKEGDYTTALQMMGKEVLSNVSRDSIKASKIPIDKVTGEYRPEIQLEMISIEDEVNKRLRDSLKTDEEYNKYNSIKGGKALAADIRAKRRVQVIKEVEADRADDFLSSITLTNYATSTLVEKKAVEAKLTIANNVLRDNIIKPQDKNDAFNEAADFIDRHVKHMMSKKYYGLKNQSKTVGLGWEEEKGLVVVNPDEFEFDEEGNMIELEDSDFKGLTLRKASTAIRKSLRLTYLAWSPVTSAKNAAQGLLMNGLKAVEGRYFGVSDLSWGYKEIVKEGNRNLMNQLYVIGDVGFSFNKRTLHNNSKLAKSVAPMMLQTETEMINQGAVALAILKKVSVKNTKTGEESNLFEQIKDGNNLSDDWISEEVEGKSGVDLVATVVLKRIRPTNAQAAGDYISAILAERGVIGQLGMTFFKYAPEMIAANFGRERNSWSEGRKVRGRIRGLFKNMYSYGVLGNREVFKDEEALIEARGAIYQLVLATSLNMLLALMYKAACLTEKCKEGRGDVVFAINFLGQVTNEFTELLNPAVPWNKITSPMAAESLLEGYKQIAAEVAHLIPGGETGRYKHKTDSFDKGSWKGWRPLGRSLPMVGTLYMRPKGMTSSVREKHNFMGMFSQ